MSVRLNHTIVWCRNRQRSATFLTGSLGLPEATPFGLTIRDLVVAADRMRYRWGAGVDESSKVHPGGRAK